MTGGPMVVRTPVPSVIGIDPDPPPQPDRPITTASITVV